MQRIFYETLLSDRKTVTDLWTAGGPAWGRTFYGFAFGGVAMAVRRIYKIRPDAVFRAKERFRDAMEAIDGVLSQQPYLEQILVSAFSVFSALIVNTSRFPGTTARRYAPLRSCRYTSCAPCARA